MKNNANASQGIRPQLVAKYLLVPVLLTVLLVLGHYGYLSKHPAKVSESTSQTSVVESASLPKHHPQVAHVEAHPESADDYPPETVAALAQFGMSPTSVVKMNVTAKARPAIILPNPLISKMQ